LENKKAERVLEELLPRELLYDLGLYIQTCAHIELYICALICEMEDLKIHSDTWIERHVGLRKMPTESLLKALRRTGESATHKDMIPRDQFNELVDWLLQYVSNRHIAVHGAFFKTPENEFRVNYWHLDKSQTPHVRQIEQTVITHDLAHDLISDADRILRILFGVLKTLRAVGQASSTC